MKHTLGQSALVMLLVNRKFVKLGPRKPNLCDIDFHVCATFGKVTYKQCDQIKQLIALWATFQSLWQQLFCPNFRHF